MDDGAQQAGSESAEGGTPSDASAQGAPSATLLIEHFPSLLRAVQDAGYQLVGPTERDGAVVLAHIEGAEDLPAGYTDEQRAGAYRLRRRADAALFGHAVGPHSWKQFLFVPRLRLWGARRDGAGFTLEPGDPSPPPRLALLGVRACDLHAIAVQDRVFRAPALVDPDYSARRDAVLVVAVNCGQAGGTCFCVSMGTGPRVATGFDLALTEVLDDPHRFVIEVGSARGAALLAGVPVATATEADRAAAAQVVARTAATMGRQLDVAGIQQLLSNAYEHARWDDVAARCLTCANCTLVCPTCFCATVEDVTDLSGTQAERWRRWDSCFSLDHSYLHGGSVRATPRARYRQWLTHKLGTWIDQFGTSGCVGCGRCITWCPSGIDLTEEIRALRADRAAGPRAGETDANGDA